MKKLIEGIVEFRNNLSDEARALFAKLALGQKPDTLFIACSDSRVVPNLFASTNPGDLFVLRNIGNLVPHLNASFQDNSVSSVLEFSIFSLHVSNIIICGHSECGAMYALTDGFDQSHCPHLASWLQHGREAVQAIKAGVFLNPSLSEVNQLSQVNVLHQMKNVASYPFIQERINKKELFIHGWWFDIAHADVYCYEPPLNQFVLIDDREAKKIMERLK